MRKHQRPPFTNTLCALSVGALILALSACASSGGEFDTAVKSNPIVNGVASGGAFPTVGYLASPGGEPFCTGTVIGARTVLTAGHCVMREGRVISPSEVRFGQGATAGAGGALLQVVGVAAHPEFRETTESLEHDVALLTLGTDVPLAATPLYDPAVSAGMEMTLVGYGVTNGPSQTGAGTKRNVNVNVSRLDTTSWRYETTGGRTACNGDSGGPAFFSVGGVLHVAGVTSWGDENCMQFGVYARIDTHADWIRAGVLTGAPVPGDPPIPPVGDEPADDPGAPLPPAGAGGALCSDTCSWPGDGVCDDGGPGAEYGDCAYGSDCQDCGPRTADGSDEGYPGANPGGYPGEDPGEYPGEYPPENPPAPAGAGGCSNSCWYAADGVCDDGGAGAEYEDCAYGTDCIDCGAR